MKFNKLKQLKYAFENERLKKLFFSIITIILNGERYLETIKSVIS